jgi:hypothetical protein
MSIPGSRLLIVSLFLVSITSQQGLICSAHCSGTSDHQNTPETKALLNGRIWFNKYAGAVGDQFFLSGTFLKGSVVFNGRKYENLDLQYDILNDEVILKIESYPVIFMNKEMVDSFSLSSGNRKYLVFNAGNNTSGELKGYVNILYNGPTSLYAKYSKKIQPLGVGGRYDLFVEEHTLYVKKGGQIFSVSSRKRFLELLDDRKKDLRHFMKSNRIRLSYKNPDSFVPVIRYYDSQEK